MNWDGMSLFPVLEQNTLGNFLDAFLELELDTFCLDYIEGMSLFLGLEQKTLGNFLDAFLELEWNTFCLDYIKDKNSIYYT